MSGGFDIGQYDIVVILFMRMTDWRFGAKLAKFGRPAVGARFGLFD